MDKEQLIEEAIEAGMGAVEFCGSVNEAIADVEGDHGIKFTADEKAEIKGRIYGKWNGARKQAGVKLKQRAGYTESLVFG